VRISRAGLVATLTPLLCGAVAAVIFSAASPATHHAPRLDVAGTAAPVTLSCQGRAQARPASMLLACADGNAGLTGLRWASWRGTAQATGMFRVNDCTPSCAAGSFHRFPAQVTLADPAPLRGQPGERYYTRITVALPGPRCYTRDGHRACYPASYTGNLWGRTSGGLPVGG
jgi:hypothetical protein